MLCPVDLHVHRHEMTVSPGTKENKGEIHSVKNVVCYRKDKADGTQFLPPPCVTGIQVRHLGLCVENY